MLAATETAPVTLQVLIIEDVDHKFEEVQTLVLNALNPTPSITRAATVVEAEDAVNSGKWDLVVVDISMDIAPGTSSSTREAHANLGGMDIIEQMYLLEKEAPTVIVTGFDYFIRVGLDTDLHEAQTFSDLEVQAREWIGSNLLGCVRYGEVGWEALLNACLQGVST